jgi:Mg-chelatase subunit ChlD
MLLDHTLLERASEASNPTPGDRDTGISERDGRGDCDEPGRGPVDDGDGTRAEPDVDVGELFDWLEREGEAGDPPDSIDIDLGDLDLADALAVDEDLDPEEDLDAGTMVTHGEAGFRESEWSDSPGQRDDRTTDYDGDAPHGAVRERLRESGLAEVIREDLREAAEEEEDTTGTEGDLLDMRNVTRRLAGDTTVEDYYRTRTTRPGDDIAVGVSVDMSGSMSGVELEAKAAVGAFLHAVQQFGGDVVANAWHDPSEVKVRLVTGPYEEFRWQHLDAVEPGGGDPIASGMLECAEMLDATRASEKLLVVITDGNPTIRSREDLRGDVSTVKAEAERTAEECRSRLDQTVIGVGVGMQISEDAMAEMFGAEYSQHCDFDELGDVLSDQFDRLFDHRGVPV